MKDARLKCIENILILSGDHLYRMDYMDFVQVSYMLQVDSVVPVLFFVAGRRYIITLFCRSTLTLGLIFQLPVFLWMKGHSPLSSLLNLFLACFWYLN